MMITSTQSTEARRRERIRDLAGITIGSFTDAELDLKIDAADKYVTLLFGGTIPNDDAKLEALITASNLYTSVLILNGLDGPRYIHLVKEQRMMLDDLVKASNGLLEAQHKPTVRITGGATPGARGFGQ